MATQSMYLGHSASCGVGCRAATPLNQATNGAGSLARKSTQAIPDKKTDSSGVRQNDWCDRTAYLCQATSMVRSGCVR
jgi:hypothetical protein